MVGIELTSLRQILYLNSKYKITINNKSIIDLQSY